MIDEYTVCKIGEYRDLGCYGILLDNIVYWYSDEAAFEYRIDKDLI